MIIFQGGQNDNTEIDPIHERETVIISSPVIYPLLIYMAKKEK
jgi:hypothetical protein